MRIILTTDSIYAASRLKDTIIKSAKGEIPEMHIDTWSYMKSSDNYDILYLNLSDFLTDPNKNVIFRVVLNGENLIFTSAYWTRNPQPDRAMICLHIGRLTEMLLTFFPQDYSKFIISD